MSAEELEEKLELDTNTLLSISSGDRAVCMLAARINAQLRGLRKERLRLQNGDAELKTAITNISHDLRTPLTAICGYLDLLEQENHTENSRRYLAVIRERTDAMNIF
jgi:signal transduction histidine kinase